MFGRKFQTSYNRSDSSSETADSPPSFPLPQSNTSTPSVRSDSPNFRDIPIDPDLTQGLLFPDSNTETQVSDPIAYTSPVGSTDGSYSFSSNQRDLSSSQSKKSTPSPPKTESDNLPTTQPVTAFIPTAIPVVASASLIPNPIPLPTTTTTSSTSKPSVPTSSTMSRSIKSLAELPLPGSKNAPKKFTGKYSKVKRFTDHVKRLIKDITTISEKEKCDVLLEYCSTKVTEFLERLNSYKTTPNFDLFITDILLYYDADLAESKWKELDLVNHVREYRRNKITTLSEWKAYNRRFIRIADWLKDKSLIDDHHYKTYFWNGIHKALQGKLEERIETANPTHDLSKPYEVDMIQKAATKHFRRDKFASLIVDSDDSDSDAEDFESTDSEDSSSSSSDSDDDKRKKKKKRKKLSSHGKYHSKTSKKMDNFRKKIQAMKEEGKDKATNSKRDTKKSEVDELVERLQNMSIDHPSYGITYYKAIVLDGRLKDCLKKPQVEFTAPSTHNSRQYKVGQRVFQISPATQPDDRRSQRLKRPPPSGERPYVWDDRCYGCGGRGHGIRSCQKITGLLNDGTILRDENTGHITMYNGEYIRKHQGEFLADAIMRMTDFQSQSKGRANLAIIKPSNCFYNQEEDEDSDNESNSDYDEYEEYDDSDEDEIEYAEDYDEEAYEYSEDEEEYVNFASAKPIHKGKRARVATYMPDTDSEDELPDSRETSRTYATNPQEFTGGPERTTRQTRSTRQTRQERPSEAPRGQTDAKKKQQEASTSTANKAPSYVPKAVKDTVQSTARTEEPPKQILQPQRTTSRHPPPGLKPQVEVPPSKWNIKPPASESQKEIRSVRKGKEKQEDIVPVSARKQRIVQDTDEDMEEVPVRIKSPKKQSKGRYQEEKENKSSPLESQPESKPPKRQARKSELSSKINDSQVISKLLDVSVPIKLGEILAVSPRVANTVSEMMRPRNQATLKTSAPVFKFSDRRDILPKALTYRSGLIRVLLNTCGRTLRAIIDTGSELNVVNKNLCGPVVQQPTDCTARMSMADAGGGETPLTGVVEQVPLSCGSVSTVANLFVGENVPFDLLLGRPWQRENMVSIDERKNGTYLVFKDLKTEKPKHELLVERALPLQLPAAWYRSPSYVLTASEQLKFPYTEYQFPKQFVTSFPINPGLNLDEPTGTVKFDGDKVSQTSPLEINHSETSASIIPVTNLLQTEKGNQDVQVPIVLQENRFMGTKNIFKNPKLFQDMYQMFASMVAYLVFMNIIAKSKLGIFSVFKENILLGKKRPPKDPSSLRNMFSGRAAAPPTLMEVPYPSPIIKPLTAHSQPISKNLDFVSRITSAGQAISGVPGGHPLVSTTVLITSQNHIPQVEEATPSYLLHGACLGAGFYQEDQTSGERTCMLGNFTYTFQPTHQSFYRETKDGAVQQHILLENGVSVPNLDTTHPNPVSVSRTFLCHTNSRACSTQTFTPPSSARSTNSSIPGLMSVSTTTAETAGRVTLDDVRSAQRLVDPRIVAHSPTPSLIYDDYLNFDTGIIDKSSEPPVEHEDKYELIKKFARDYAKEDESDSDESEDSSMSEDYDELDSSSDAFSISSTPLCFQATILPPTSTQKLRDDTPHPTTGHVLLNSNEKYKIFDTPHPAPPLTSDEAQMLYEYAVNAKKKFDGKDSERMEQESIHEPEEEMEKDTGLEPWYAVKTRSPWVSQTHERKSHSEPDPDTFDKGNEPPTLDTSTTAPPIGRSTLCRQPPDQPEHPTCHQLASLFANKDYLTHDYPSLKTPHIYLQDIATDCCDIAPHTVSEYVFNCLREEIERNAYTRDKRNRNKFLTNYLYDRGGGELLVKEATKLRGVVESYLRALLVEAGGREWKPHEGSIRPRCFRKIVGYDAPVYGHHYVISQELIPNYFNPKSDLLSAAEEAAFLALHDMYVDHKCQRTARRINFVINLQVIDGKLLRNWNSFGLLSSERLLRNRNLYHPQPVVEIGDWEFKPYIDEFADIY